MATGVKICIFTTSIDKKDGGPSRSVPLLAKGLAELGEDVTLFTIETDDMNTHILEGTKVKMIIVNRTNFRKTAKKILIDNNFDIIHCQNLWDPFYNVICRIARRLNIPYIMTPRGTLEPWSLSQKKIKKLIALFLYQKRDLQKSCCVLATADMEANNLRELGIKPPIAVIPNGIDLSEYPFKHDRRIKKQILFLSRIHPKKGIELLIAVWSKLKDKYPEWNIVIAGNGEEDYICELNDLIIKTNLNNVVRIIPPVFGSNKYNLYSESAIFVLPTYSENFGMVVAEAMSCGVPVITTTGTPWNILNEKRMGWCIDLSESNLEQALTEAIDTGIDDLRIKGENSSDYIKENLSYISVAERNLSVYKWIVKKTNTPNCVKIN